MYQDVSGKCRKGTGKCVTPATRSRTCPYAENALVVDDGPSALGRGCVCTVSPGETTAGLFTTSRRSTPRSPLRRAPPESIACLVLAPRGIRHCARHRTGLRHPKAGNYGQLMRVLAASLSAVAGYPVGLSGSGTALGMARTFQPAPAPAFFWARGFPMNTMLMRRTRRFSPVSCRTSSEHVAK